MNLTYQQFRPSCVNLVLQRFRVCAQHSTTGLLLTYYLAAYYLGMIINILSVSDSIVK